MDSILSASNEVFWCDDLATVNFDKEVSCFLDLTGSFDIRNLKLTSRRNINFVRILTGIDENTRTWAIVSILANV